MSRLNGKNNEWRDGLEIQIKDRLLRANKKSNAKGCICYCTSYSLVVHKNALQNPRAGELVIN